LTTLISGLVFYYVATGRRVFSSITEIENFIISQRDVDLTSIGDDAIRSFLAKNFLSRAAEGRSLRAAKNDSFLDFDFLPSADSVIRAQNEFNLAESNQAGERFLTARDHYTAAKKHFTAAAFWADDGAEAVKFQSKSTRCAAMEQVLCPNDLFGAEL